MAPSRTLRLVAKALLQIGIEPMALYALYQLGLRTGYYKWLERRLVREARQVPAILRPMLVLPDRQAVESLLNREAKARLLREANEVVGGRARLFGGSSVPLHMNFDSRLRHWTEYELKRMPVPPVRVSKAVPKRPGNHRAGSGDIKFVWESARFGWAFALGRAYHLTQREKYAEAFWRHFEGFDRSNPPYFGPHWMNGQEVAIRLMALVWSSHVFASAASTRPRRQLRLAHSIAQHAARIKSTLVYARSQNNNHLLTESAALYTAGAVLGQREWLALGWRWLNAALQRQISSFGEYIQHSTNYHRLMLQVALWADAIRRGRGENWPSPTRAALARAAHWLFSMLDPASGRAPNLGPNDGALLLPLSSCEFSDFRPTVQASARAFLRTGLPAGNWDELPVWLGLKPTVQTADSTVYAADHLRGGNSWAYLRASSFKSRLSHMDQLHLDLWWQGLNIAQDPGTYLYNGEPPWDNPLVSTCVHNTVTVDGADQMLRAGRFLTLDWCPAYSKHVLPRESRILGRILASHEAYRRLGIRHERLASVIEDGHWQVEDALVFRQAREHTLRLHWLLLDGDWQLKAADAEVRFRLRTPSGWIKLRITGSGFSRPRLSTTLIRAGKLLFGSGHPLAYAGWLSPTYGSKVPALSLAVEAVASRTCRFVSEFTLPR